ncbi:hypothetical protein [Nonomuraea montanisoli]|uniref:hypothetical protein n=1 Tax=Nonomuraea montanisoli TaxID=2741721 RepID=UPI002E2B69F2|nr:hypothetical protein [Nonomuraea montanisoli]
MVEKAHRIFALRPHLPDEKGLLYREEDAPGADEAKDRANIILAEFLDDLLGDEAP